MQFFDYGYQDAKIHKPLLDDIFLYDEIKNNVNNTNSNTYDTHETSHLELDLDVDINKGLNLSKDNDSY